jgi:hypothetical protein
VSDAAFAVLPEPCLKFGITTKLLGHNLQMIPVMVVVVVVAAAAAAMMIILRKVKKVILHYSTLLKSFSSKQTTLFIDIAIYH